MCPWWRCARNPMKYHSCMICLCFTDYQLWAIRALNYLLCVAALCLSDWYAWYMNIKCPPMSHISVHMSVQNIIWNAPPTSPVNHQIRDICSLSLTTLPRRQPDVYTNETDTWHDIYNRVISLPEWGYDRKGVSNNFHFKVQKHKLGCCNLVVASLGLLMSEQTREYVN